MAKLVVRRCFGAGIFASGVFSVSHQTKQDVVLCSNSTGIDVTLPVALGVAGVASSIAWLFADVGGDSSWSERGDDLFSWHHRRTDRSRVLVSDEEVVKISALINVLIDMPYWTETEEQEMFEHAVTMVLNEIAEVVPKPFASLMKPKRTFLDDLDERGWDELFNSLDKVCWCGSMISTMAFPYHACD